MTKETGKLSVAEQTIERDNYFTVAALAPELAANFIGLKHTVYKVVDTGPDTRPRYSGTNVRVFELYVSAEAWRAEQKKRALDLITEWRDAADSLADGSGNASTAYNACARALEDLLNRA